MPLDDDAVISHNYDGTFNEDYCKWCYTDGIYTYNDMNDFIEVCVKNMVNEDFTEEQVRSNELHIEGLPRVEKLNALVGKYVNLEYMLPNGNRVKFLDDSKT